MDHQPNFTRPGARSGRYRKIMQKCEIKLKTKGKMQLILVMLENRVPLRDSIHEKNHLQFERI